MGFPVSTTFWGHVTSLLHLFNNLPQYSHYIKEKGACLTSSTLSDYREKNKNIPSLWPLHVLHQLRVFAVTLPKTNSSPLKMVDSNRNFLFQGSIFRGQLLVSGRVTRIAFQWCGRSEGWRNFQTDFISSTCKRWRKTKHVTYVSIEKTWKDVGQNFFETTKNHWNLNNIIYKNKTSRFLLGIC